MSLAVLRKLCTYAAPQRKPGEVGNGGLHLAVVQTEKGSSLSVFFIQNEALSRKSRLQLKETNLIP